MYAAIFRLEHSYETESMYVLRIVFDAFSNDIFST